LLATLSTLAVAVERPIDFNGNGKTDLLFPQQNGMFTIWLMDGTRVLASRTYNLGGDWNLDRWTEDRNGDGKTDIVLYRIEIVSSFPFIYRIVEMSLWVMNGLDYTAVALPLGYGGSVNLDFNGDGKNDVLVEAGGWTIKLLDGPAVIDSRQYVIDDPHPPGHNWGAWSHNLRETVDFNGDGKSDLLWRRAGTEYEGGPGETAIWLMDGMGVKAAALYKPEGGPWGPVGVGDFNGDGKADILWGSADYRMAVWLMDGVAVLDYAFLPNQPRP
jgi:hypothetical protein